MGGNESTSISESNQRIKNTTQIKQTITQINEKIINNIMNISKSCGSASQQSANINISNVDTVDFYPHLLY